MKLPARRLAYLAATVWCMLPAACSGSDLPSWAADTDTWSRYRDVDSPL